MGKERKNHKLIGVSPNPYGIIFECKDCGKCFGSSAEVMGSEECKPKKDEAING